VSEDQFGTVNVRRQQMARELEALRQHYIAHRETLARLEKDAPSEQLALRYIELQREIDVALSKLDELASPSPREDRPTAPGSPHPDPRPATVAVPAAPPMPQHRTAPGSPATTADWKERPVAPAPVHDSIVEAPDDNRRLLLLVLITVLVLAGLGYLVWRFTAGDKGEPATIVEETAAEETVAPGTVTETVAAESSSTLTVSPTSHDFGVIRKGTRAVRQFRLANNSDKPVQVSIARSQCRCLWFDYDQTIPAKGSTVLAITVDGAKAKSGALAERVSISANDSTENKSYIELSANVE
jgi:hypothetical protein